MMPFGLFHLRSYLGKSLLYHVRLPWHIFNEPFGLRPHKGVIGMAAVTVCAKKQVTVFAICFHIIGLEAWATCYFDIILFNLLCLMLKKHSPGMLRSKTSPAKYDIGTSLADSARLLLETYLARLWFLRPQQIGDDPRELILDYITFLTAGLTHQIERARFESEAISFS